MVARQSVAVGIRSSVRRAVRRGQESQQLSVVAWGREVVVAAIVACTPGELGAPGTVAARLHHANDDGEPARVRRVERLSAHQTRSRDARCWLSMRPPRPGGGACPGVLAEAGAWSSDRSGDWTFSGDQSRLTVTDVSAGHADRVHPEMGVAEPPKRGTDRS